MCEGEGQIIGGVNAEASKWEEKRGAPGFDLAGSVKEIFTGEGRHFKRHVKRPNQKRSRKNGEQRSFI